MQITITGVFGGIIAVIVLYVIIGLAWAGVEKLLYGKTIPSKIDDVVAVILAISLYFNLK